MRIFVNERMAGLVETIERIPKGNCGSRKGCSIDDWILEKRLLWDCSMQNMEQIVHKFTCLESCYDRQLENACRVVEEALVVYMLAIKLFTKVTSQFEYWICTDFGISKKLHGGRCDPLGGLGQGMILSGSNNRDISSFIFKSLEEKRCWFSNFDSIKLEKMFKTALAFVDDTNLW